MIRSATAALVGSVLALLSGAVAAQATTTQASLSDYGWQVVDLNPDDGIAPSITFANIARGAQTGAVAHYGDLLSFLGESSIDGETVSSASDIGGAAVTTTYSQQAITAHGSIGKAGQYMSFAGWNSDYTLSANTKLVFTGHAAAAVTPGAYVPDQFSSAGVSIMFTDGIIDGTLVQPYYARTATFPNVPDTVNFDETFTLEIVNNSADALTGRMNILVFTTADVSAVPEPATYLMLGAGLALTGALARRRRASKAN
jgi:hypothetical protein